MDSNLVRPERRAHFPNHTKANMKLVAGVDIGGTSVKVGVVDAEGRVLARAQQQIHASEQEAESVVALACALLQQALGEVRTMNDAELVM